MSKNKYSTNGYELSVSELVSIAKMPPRPQLYVDGNGQAVNCYIEKNQLHRNINRNLASSPLAGYALIVPTLDGIHCRRFNRQSSATAGRDRFRCRGCLTLIDSPQNQVQGAPRCIVVTHAAPHTVYSMGGGPHDGHVPGCLPLPITDQVAKRVRVEISEELNREPNTNISLLRQKMLKNAASSVYNDPLISNSGLGEAAAMDSILISMGKHMDRKTKMEQKARKKYAPRIRDVHAQLPDACRTTARAHMSAPNGHFFGEQFLLFEEAPRADGCPPVRVFSSPAQLDFLRQSTVWAADGTFRTCALEYGAGGQLFTIMGKHNKNQNVPAVWALMPRRRKRDYVLVFEALLAALMNIGGVTAAPKVMLFDHEKASANAFRDVFHVRTDASWTIKKCRFHYGQAIVRRAAFLGLKPYFMGRQNDQFVADRIHELIGMAMCPPERMDEVFRSIRTRGPHANPMIRHKLGRLYAYFRKQWLGFRRGTNVQGRLEYRSTWTHFGSTAPKTTNMLEGKHRDYKASYGRAGKGSTSHVVSWLQSMEMRAYAEIKTLDDPQTLDKRRHPVYVQLEQTLHNAGQVLLQMLPPQNVALNQNQCNTLRNYLRHVAHITRAARREVRNH